MVEVHLFAFFRDGRGPVLSFDEHEVPDGNALLRELDIDPDQVGIYLINGFHQPHDTPFQAGDIVSLFPPVAGG